MRVYLTHRCPDKGLKGTVVNRTCMAINGRSLEFTRTVPYRSIDIDKLNPPCAESVQGWAEYRSRRRRKTFSRQRNLQPETQPWFKTVFFLHLETGIKLLTPSPLFHDPWQSIWDFISPTSVYPPLYSNLFIHLYIYISIYLSTYLSSLYLPNSPYLNI